MATWNTLNPLPTSRCFPAAAVHGDYLYVLGGSSQVSAPFSTYRLPVLKARISPDGDLGAWTSACADLTAGKNGAALFISPTGVMYVMGGLQPDTSSDPSLAQQILTGKLDVDGNVLGGVLTASKALPKNFQAASVAVGGEWVYCLGGSHSTIALTFKTQSGNFTAAETVTGLTSGATATIVSDTDSGTTGTLKLKLITGTFVDAETIRGGTAGRAVANGAPSAYKLDYKTQTANFHAGVAITGGTSGATATISSDSDAGTTGTLTLTGVVGTFQNNELITDTTTGSATCDGVLYKTLAYTGETGNFVAGEVVTGTTSSAVLTVESGTDTGSAGVLTAAAATGLPFTDSEVITGTAVGSALADGANTVTSTDVTTIYRARFSPDGSLSAWASIGTLPTASVGGGSFAAIGSTLYYSAGGLLYFATVNGLSIDAWQNIAVPATLANQAMVAIQGRLILLGGDVSGTDKNTVYVLHVDSDGVPRKAWFRTADLPAILSRFGSAVKNDRIFIVGGRSTATAQTTVYAAKFLTGALGGERIKL